MEVITKEEETVIACLSFTTVARSQQGARQRDRLAEASLTFGAPRERGCGRALP